uniref:Formylglycine-generating enzyme family protein n=1 Tax=Candidatus Desulfatibia profunda TaxID=2841695 RepID=A0A8J6TI33_9BACT|nr:formylglycine-generating enzyme family protein [Candidatus Desulfatibia profunda]
MALGEMVEVPAGVFQYGHEKQPVEIDRPFQIDIYPVTNRQFEEFIRDNGYQNDDIWSDEGRKWRQKNGIKLPAFWNDQKWNLPEHPVVGVSFYEAQAFAKWAGKELSSEQQWERAARGTDGRKYPWGDKFDREKCNTQESGIGKTTRVTRYPHGISPVGCYDMAGNVWEWTQSYDDDEKDLIVLRGGCWDDYQDAARCAFRTRFDPFYRTGFVGFRCVRTLT